MFTGTIRRLRVYALLGLTLVVAGTGASCPGGIGGNGDGGIGGGGSPTPPEGNRPPRIVITDLSTTDIPPGGSVQMIVTAEDAEDVAFARVFASTVLNPTQAQEITIESPYEVNPLIPSRQITWDTSTGGVTLGTYYIYGEIDDRTYNPADGTGNPPVRVVASSTVTVSSQPAPFVSMISPNVNLGVSAGDEVTIRYSYANTYRPVIVTLLLDKNRNASPFDPANPTANTDLIVLPSTAPQSTDPTFPDADDTANIRTNPRQLPATTPGAPLPVKEYRFDIDTTLIPILNPPQPYFIRAFVTDDGGNNKVNSYAIGSVTVIPQLASGIVDVGQVGSQFAGTRFQGFIQYENLGSSFLPPDESISSDIDGDGCAEFMIVSKYGRPKNRPGGPGTAYLVFGRPAEPFPALDEFGMPTGFPTPPVYVPNPYDASNVGRFGGIISINSIGSFFRGGLYGMPESTIEPEYFPGNDPPYNTWPLSILQILNPYLDGNNPPGDFDARQSAGLFSVARLDLTGDGTPDFVFGLPLTGANDFIDDDPADGGCPLPAPDPDEQASPGPYDHPPTGLGMPNTFVNYIIDRFPNAKRNNAPGQGPPPILAGNDDMGSVPQGLVIAVDGTTNIGNNLFVDVGLAGQFDPARVQTDEGLIPTPPFPSASVPNGFRIRGGWFDGASDGAANFMDSFNAMGATVSSVPSIDVGGTPDLLESSPGYNNSRGRVTIWLSRDYTDAGIYGADGVRSMPGFRPCDLSTGSMDEPVIIAPTCYQEVIPAMDPIPERTDNWGCRAIVIPPARFSFVGESSQSQLGNAGSAGQFNQDGVPDLLMGAPGFDTNKGRVYFLFMPAGGLIHSSSINDVPRAFITGTHNGDGFGRMQTSIGDLNADGIDDVAFSAQGFPATNVPGPAPFCGQALPSQPIGAGYVGVIFGNRPLTGEIGFNPEDVGTQCLEGVVFLGTVANGRAGHQIASAGDFNADGYGDFLISSPGEIFVDGTGNMRVGKAYLIFGGPHLNRVSGQATNYRSLSAVGTPALPGIVFYGRAYLGDPVTYPGTKIFVPTLESVAGIDDIDGDGYDDIAIGAPHMDFVNDPSAPSQRRIDAGEVYIIYGNSSGTNLLPGN